MLIGCISDTHGKHNEIIFDDGYPDVLIHAGDGTNQRDTFLNRLELIQLLDWYHALPIKYKIYSPGNHDVFIERHREEFLDMLSRNFPSIIYLEDEVYTLNVEGKELKIFASPKTPSYGANWAFNVARHKLPRFWEMAIPEDLDILITHGPPKGILDYTNNKGGEHVGCSGLLNTVIRQQPKLHIFGHLHDENGIYNNGIFSTPKIPTTFINASIVDLHHNVVNRPIIINYE